MHGADVEPGGELSGDLGRAEDVGRERDVGPVGVRDVALRGAADAAAVDEGRLGPVEAPVVVGALVAEAEDASVLDEERALLLEVRLHVGEVDHRGIHLDLTEVRVGGGIEGEPTAHAHAQVGASGRRVLAAAPERIVPIPGQVFGLAGGVGRELDRVARMEVGETAELGEARDEPALGPRRIDQPVALVAARDLAPEVDTPGAVRGAMVEAKLGERDPHLGGPAVAGAAGLALPHAVPGIVVPAVVEQRPIGEHARRVDGEVVAAAPVVERIEEQDEAVAGHALVAPAQARDDRVGVRVPHPRPDVERVVVVGDAHFGALGRRLAFVLIGLEPAGHGWRLLPDRLVELAVHVHRLRQAHRLDRARDEAVGCGRDSRRGSADRGDQDQSCGQCELHGGPARGRSDIRGCEGIGRTNLSSG